MVLAASGALGVIWIAVPPLIRLTVLGTAGKVQQTSCTRLTVVVFTVAGFSVSLNPMSMTAFVGTAEQHCGLTLTTLGAIVLVSATVRNDPW